MAISRDSKIQSFFQLPLITSSVENSLVGSHSRSALPADWRVDDNELAADFDGSLSGLGMDLAGIPYNMRLFIGSYLLFISSHSLFIGCYLCFFIIKEIMEFLVN